MGYLERIVGPAVLLFGSLGAAAAPINNPVFFNVYWERAGRTWDTDVVDAGAAAGNPDIALMTRDMIDSFLESAMVSNWPNNLQAWGVKSVYFQPVSLELVPEAESNAACSGVTPGDDYLYDWETNLPKFIPCLVATHQNQWPVALTAPNAVINVFIPPEIQGSADGGDPCLQDQTLGVNVTAGATDETVYAYNGFVRVDGGTFTVAVLPTERYCVSGFRKSLAYTVTHEDVEAAVGGNGGTVPGRQLADPCEPYGLPGFLEFQNGPAQYVQNTDAGVIVEWNAGTVSCHDQTTDAGVNCTCGPDAGPIPDAGVAPQVTACGSGRHMILQAQVDASRNPPPWDLPDAPWNSFEGSLYFQVQSGASGFAGGAHFASEVDGGVETGLLDWSSGGGTTFIEMHGFGDGYSYARFPNQPGSTVFAYVYDSVWGRPNLWNGRIPSATVEQPYQFGGVAATASDRGGWIVTGELGGNPNCGLTGHPVGSMPMGDAPITIVALAAAGCPHAVMTDDDGNFSFVCYPTTIEPQTIGLKTDGRASTAVYINPPHIDSIVTPGVAGGAVELVGGGLPITITGSGLKDYASPTTTEVTTEYEGNEWFASSVAGTATSLTVSGLHSPITSDGGVGVANVFVTVNGVPSNSLPVTYFIPNVPYLTFKACDCTTCAPNQRTEVTPLVRSDTGAPEAAIISLSAISAIRFSPSVVWNGQTSEALFPVPEGAPYRFSATAVTWSPWRWAGGRFTGGFSKETVTPVTLPIFGPPSARDCHLVENVNPLDPTRWWWHPRRPYQFDGRVWVDPAAGEALDRLLPSIVSIESAYSQYALNVAALGSEAIRALESYVSPSRIFAAAIPHAPPSGQNLCLTERALDISAPGGTANWEARVAFPLDSAVPPGNFRVFGLNRAEGGWVEMPVTFNRTPAGMAEALATLTTWDPHGLVPGVVDGPYALMYYSDQPCEASATIPLEGDFLGSGTPKPVCTGTSPAYCNRSCTDLSDDVKNCGGCGDACGGASPACCAGKCLDLANDAHNCGACGDTCAAGSACCAGQCVGLANDPQNCGACGHVCSGTNPACCAGQCHDLANDKADCGACGKACSAAGSACCSGVCKEIDGTDTASCGACGNTCGGDHPACCGGSCKDFDNDPSNCGGCGHACCCGIGGCWWRSCAWGVCCL